MSQYLNVLDAAEQIEKASERCSHWSPSVQLSIMNNVSKLALHLLAIYLMISTQMDNLEVVHNGPSWRVMARVYDSDGSSGLEELSMRVQGVLVEGTDLLGTQTGRSSGKNDLYVQSFSVSCPF